MSDRARQALAFVIAIGMVIAVASAPTVAQVADPSSEQVFELAALNADTVDGRHATKYTTTRGKRAGKLVATNSNGYLPSNILKPQWRVIQNMPGGFADGVDNAGIAGARVIRVTGPNEPIAPGEEASSTASCPSGSVVVGGGGYGSHRTVHLSTSYPADGSSWRAHGTNTSTGDKTIRAYAMCLSTLPSGLVTTAGKGAAPASKRR